MHSIREIYRIGRGPSSSHTMGPAKAAAIFRQHHPQAQSFRVHLYGSLAATGRGHLTDLAIQHSLEPLEVSFTWQPERVPDFHPNGMCLQALDANGEVIGEWEVYSVGGGALSEITPSGWLPEYKSVYQLTTMTEILKHCAHSGQGMWEFVEENEGSEIWDFLSEVWERMQAAIERGLQAEGVLPGGLGLARKAWVFYRRASASGQNFLNEGLLPAYALATVEENASGGIVVTAPTCGSCGIVPAVLRHVQENIRCSTRSIWRALATAGLIGALVKHNASISGAEVGCQGEVGVACAMAAGAAAQLMGGTPRQIEYAAEMGLEHHLGLTCDPVHGLVQIPCIERNVFAAARALSCTRYACSTDGSHRVSFDEVVTVMKQTGHDLPSLYRETASGGLAKSYRFPPKNSEQGSR
ncbi:MAG TPA: L-serine ammonia-lyase [Anaerolineales bacterium]|nr:L-serine ammonia-lyase [Anaerolineales bacterium]